MLGNILRVNEPKLASIVEPMIIYSNVYFRFFSNFNFHFLTMSNIVNNVVKLWCFGDVDVSYMAVFSSSFCRGLGFIFLC